jgi:hypothetical protein
MLRYGATATSISKRSQNERIHEKLLFFVVKNNFTLIATYFTVIFTDFRKHFCDHRHKEKYGAGTSFSHAQTQQLCENTHLGSDGVFKCETDREIYLTEIR